MHVSLTILPANLCVLAFTWCVLLCLLQPPTAALPRLCDPSLMPGPCGCIASGGPWALQMLTCHGGATAEIIRANIDTSGKQQLTRQLHRWLPAAQCHLPLSVHPAVHQALSKLSLDAGRRAQPTSRPSISPAHTALSMGGIPFSESSVLPGMLIGHRQIDRTCKMQMQFKLGVKQPDAKFEIPFICAPLICTVIEGLWSEGQLWLLVDLPSSAAPACKAVGAIREGLVSWGQDQPVPGRSKGWHGVSGRLR